MRGVAHDRRAEPAVAVRGGVRGAWRRLQKRPGVIAYLGASATFQTEGFRPRLHARLEQALPSPRMVNAGVPGTGSMAGLCLMDDLVVRHDPDLCLVELFTGDAIGNYTPPAMITDAVHGIAEKLLAAGCTPIFVYLTGRDVDDSHMAAIRDLWEAVARTFRIASIDLGPVQREAATPDTTAVYRDYAHLTAPGADLVADAMFDALVQLSETAGASERTRAGTAVHSRFAEAYVLPVALDHVREPAAARQRRYRLVRDYVEIGPDTCFELQSDDELIGMAVIFGPSGGLIRVTDGESSFELDLWDECGYDRFGAVVFPRACPAGTRVTTELVGPSPLSPDQDAPPLLSIFGFLAIPSAPDPGGLTT